VTTTLLKRDLTGSPHIPGDYVQVQDQDGGWHEALVLDVQRSPGRFGLDWLLEVEPEPMGEGTTLVRCDGNGRNLTAGRGVRASQRLEA
jgi:hypothetical protein